MKNGLPFSILIVEDDEDDRFILDEAFKEIGNECEVKKVINGEMLFHYLEQIEPELYPSLIVLDNTLPGMNASELLKLLKGSDKYKEIPVVIQSNSMPPSKTSELESLGAFACFTKGSNMDEMIGLVNRFRQIASERLKDEQPTGTKHK